MMMDNLLELEKSIYQLKRLLKEPDFINFEEIKEAEIRRVQEAITEKACWY